MGESGLLTAQDVHSIQFEKTFRGYRIADVDRFLDKVEEQVRANADENERLRQRLDALKEENQHLAKELADCKADGDIVKSAMINAQRIGENVIREANQKSEEIIHRANIKSDDIVRDANDLLQKATQRADEIINEAAERRRAEEREYERVRLEIARFKSDVLNLYRSHVESLSRLPEYKKPEPAAPAPQPEPEGPSAPDSAPEAAAAQQPAAESAEADDRSEDFWSKDESELTASAPAPETDYSAFQGIQFSE